jgi:hypothetical protein
MRRVKFLYLFLSLLGLNQISTVAFAQPTNLVINPSFENYVVCNSGGLTSINFPPWKSPSYGTPDSYHSCTTHSASTVPNNTRSFQYARTGNGYMGLFPYLDDGFFINKEYNKGKLSIPMLPGKIYAAEYYVNLAYPTNTWYNFFALAEFGMYFSVDSIYFNSINVLPLIPQIESPQGLFFTDTLNWNIVKGLYTANGGEKFITLGSFKLITDTLRIFSSTENSSTFMSYYYIDDVSVTEIGTAYTATACNNYTWQGTTYTQSGVYTDTVQGYWGTDSLLQLTLTINSSNGPTVNYSGCSAYTYNGVTYNNSGTYTQTFSNWLGCDSIITLNVNIVGNSVGFLPITACNSFTLNGQTYTSSGNYTQQLSNWLGCDSVLTLELAIINLNNTVTENNAVLTSTSIGTSYQWLQCHNNGTYTAITNATTQTYTATANADYAVIITDNNGCIDTSNCVNVNSVSSDELLTMDDELKIFPNPTSTHLTIELVGNSTIKEIKIYNMFGECVLASPLLRGGREGLLDLSALPNGVYFVEIKTDKVVLFRKFVKQ